MLRFICLSILLLGLTGCASVFEAQALHFNKGIQLHAGKTFAIVAEGGQQNNLEFNHYAELVNTQLQLNGLQQAGSLGGADYRVTFVYGTDGGQQVVESYPDYGLYGGYGSYGSMIGVGGTFYPPPHTRVTSYALYTHRFELRMQDARTHNMPTVFQGRVITAVSDPSLTSVMPCLVKVMFVEFPGPDGVEREVRIPSEACRQ